MYINNPDTKTLFTRVNVDNENSPEYQAHILRVANAFDDVLNKLHSHQVMDSMVEHLAFAHEDRKGMKKHHFQVSNINVNSHKCYRNYKFNHLFKWMYFNIFVIYECIIPFSESCCSNWQHVAHCSW